VPVFSAEILTRRRCKSGLLVKKLEEWCQNSCFS